MGCSYTEVDLIRCRASKRHVGTIFVVPESEPMKLTTKVGAAHGYDQPPSAFVFQRQDEPLHHGEAAVPPNRAITRRFDAFSFHPAAKRVAVEDTFSVANDVLRCSACLMDRLTQEGADSAAVGPVREGPDLHDPA